MISINRSSQKYGEEFQIDDYRQTFQTTEISDYPINGILYPVMGFPSMIAEELLSLSVIFKFKTEGKWLSEYDIEYVKIIRTDDSGKHEFLSLYPRYKGVVYKIGTDLWILKIGMASMLPEARYDIVLKIFNEEEIVSRNAVFFPHNEHSFADPTKFIVFSNLLTGESCESAEDSDFNSGEYPRSDSEPLTKAIINTAFSQINSSGSHFSVMLGDAVCGTDFQNEYRDFYNTALHLEIPMFAVPGDRDVHTRFSENDTGTAFFIEFDGLDYWTRFIAPANNVFRLRGMTYLLLNTQEGTPQKRSSDFSEEISGTDFQQDTLWWLEGGLDNAQMNFAAVFGHSMPNHEMQPSDTDQKFLEIMTQKKTMPLYFSGHGGEDSVVTFDKNDELVGGVTAPEKMEFISTTASSGNGKGYRGFRKVEMSYRDYTDDHTSYYYKTVSYNYTCGRYENCQPESEENKGMQSVPAGNMWVKYLWESGSGEKESLFSGGDGSSESVTAEIVNYLPTDEEVTLRFIMPAAKYG